MLHGIKRSSFESTIEARVVYAKFHGLSFRFHDTGMDAWLNWRVLFAGWYIKRALQRAIEEKMREIIEGFDHKITKIRQSVAQS